MNLRELLPARLYECVVLACLGFSNKQIAMAMRLKSGNMVRNYFRMTYEILEIGNSVITGKRDEHSRMLVCTRWAREAMAGAYMYPKSYKLGNDGRKIRLYIPSAQEIKLDARI